MLALLLRTAHSADTGQYVLDSAYELATVREGLDNAIDRGQSFRILLESGTPLLVNPEDYRVIAVVEYERLQGNRQRFRGK